MFKFDFVCADRHVTAEKEMNSSKIILLYIVLIFLQRLNVRDRKILHAYINFSTLKVDLVGIHLWC